jgi:hypothetical protein
MLKWYHQINATNSNSGSGDGVQTGLEL